MTEHCLTQVSCVPLFSNNHTCLLSGIREIIFGKRTAEFPLPKSLNGKFDSLPPVEGLIFEFVFDFKARGQWKHWNDIIKNMEIEDMFNYKDVFVSWGWSGVWGASLHQVWGQLHSE